MTFKQRFSLSSGSGNAVDLSDLDWYSYGALYIPWTSLSGTWTLEIQTIFTGSAQTIQTWTLDSSVNGSSGVMFTDPFELPFTNLQFVQTYTTTPWGSIAPILFAVGA